MRLFYPLFPRMSSDYASLFGLDVMFYLPVRDRIWYRLLLRVL